MNVRIVARRRAAAGAVAAALLVGLMLALAPSAGAADSTCPRFRVLHNDRIGPAVLPAGSYTVTVDGAGLTCANASRLFTRFLEDWDGVLPRPWRVVAQGRGRATFRRGNRAGFSVALGSGGGNNSLGRLCARPFVVNAATRVGPLLFVRGRYLLYTPPRSGIACRRAAILFTRFLGAPGGRLPSPWQLTNQTATFFKPEHPVRSSFRVESATGAGA